MQNSQAGRGCAGKPYRQRFAAAGVHGAGQRPGIVRGAGFCGQAFLNHQTHNRRVWL